MCVCVCVCVFVCVCVCVIYKYIFCQELCTSLSSETVLDWNSFEENFLGVLNKHAPLKEKVLRANHAPYVTKALKKAIMKRSYLEKPYLKKKAAEP